MSVTSDITIKYNDSPIAEISQSGVTTLETAGKWLEDNISISYTKPSGGSSYRVFKMLIDATATSSGDIEYPTGLTYNDLNTAHTTDSMSMILQAVDTDRGEPTVQYMFLTPKYISPNSSLGDVTFGAEDETLDPYEYLALSFSQSGITFDASYMQAYLLTIYLDLEAPEEIQKALCLNDDITGEAFAGQIAGLRNDYFTDSYVTLFDENGTLLDTCPLASFEGVSGATATYTGEHFNVLVAVGNVVTTPNNTYVIGPFVFVSFTQYDSASLATPTRCELNVTLI